MVDFFSTTKKVRKEEELEKQRVFFIYFEAVRTTKQTNKQKNRIMESPLTEDKTNFSIMQKKIYIFKIINKTGALLYSCYIRQK